MGSPQRQYSDEEKAAALAALLEGQSVRYVAKEYNIPMGTLKYWRGKNTPSTVDPKKAEEIGDLLLEYLRSNLTALQAQAKQFADPQWLSQQGASEAAVLHGVMTDKAIRLIEAMGRAGVTNDRASAD